MMMAMKSKPTGNPDWKGELQGLLDDNNELHALRRKTNSHRTQAARAHGVFRMFRLLRHAGYRIGPLSLGGRHVEFLMAYWTADPAIAEGLRTRGSKLQVRDVPYSAAYIQQQLSFLRALCAWIGKAGLVLPAHRYVSNPELVSRSGNATRDRTWSGSMIDADEVLAVVYQADPVVGFQLEVLLVFGLRCKEAVMFSPALAEVPAHALPAEMSEGSYLAFVCITRGTKGGRVRYTALRNDHQRKVLERAKEIAPHPGMHIGRPGQTLKQALTRFRNVLHRCGVTRRVLGVTAHGLRHEFAADLYFELTEVPAPVKGGPLNLDPKVMEAAYLEVARQLGHGRPRITGAYLGSRRSKQDRLGMAPENEGQD
jgi:integrase